MSLITYTPLNPADHDWIAPDERALVIDDGKHKGKVVVLQMKRLESDVNADGIPDVLIIETIGRITDENGQTRTVGDTLVKTARNIESIQLEAISSGSHDINEWISDLIDAAVHRTLRHESALLAWQSIPL